MATKKPQTDMPVARVGEVAPQFLTQYTGAQVPDTLETMRHHRILNRVAIVQAMSPREKKEKYGEGSCCIPATETKLAGLDEPFEVVPVMFFDEFIQWAHRDDKEGAMIRERSLDRASVLAAKCGDPKRWDEPYENGKFKARNTHHLNFLAVVYSGELKGTLVVISFARGEYKKGTTWMGAIKQRRVGGFQAPLWSTRWTFKTTPHTNGKDEWYGFDFEPADKPWIEAEDAEQLKAMHEQLLKDYKDQILEVGHAAAESASESQPDLRGATDM